MATIDVQTEDSAKLTPENEDLDALYMAAQNMLLKLHSRMREIDSYQDINSLIIEYDECRDLLTSAANGGHLRAQMRLADFYLRGVNITLYDRGVCLLDEVRYQDPYECIIWYATAAANGSAEAFFMLGLIKEKGIESGFYGTDVLSGVKPTVLRPVIKSAGRYYFAAAQQNHPEAQYRLALLYESGKGVIKSNVKHYKWLFRSAYNGFVQAQRELGQLLISDKLFKPDYHEAYIWAVICNRDDCSGAAELISTAAAKLSRVQEIKAQKEAKNRFTDIIKQENIPSYTDDEFERMVLERIKRESETQAPSRPDATPEPMAKAPRKNYPGDKEVLKTWKVTELGKITIHINQKEANLVVSYGKKKARFAIDELFGRSGAALLIDHARHLSSASEPPVSYHGTSINQRLGLTRENNKVVSDFCCCFRKLFGLDKDQKAFIWLPGKKNEHRYKSLKANFNLKVNYRV